MSRHRFVRNMDYDDYLDDDSYDSYSEEEEAVVELESRRQESTYDVFAKPAYQAKTQKKVEREPESKRKIFYVNELKHATRNESSTAEKLAVLNIKSSIVPEVQNETASSIAAPEKRVAEKSETNLSKSKVTLNDQEAIQALLAGKPNINIVIIGHVDSGKSTLMGHLLHLLNVTSDKQLRKQTKMAQELGKKSFEFAWTMDATEEERERGITMDVGMASFETTNRKFTILDAPGHKDFVPNMISGTSQADIGILVIDSKQGAFESGFTLGGQTKEHVLLAKSLGVAELIVVINKCDHNDWDPTRYNLILDQLTVFLEQLNIKSVFIPVSGLLGLNITQKHSTKWYSGPSLLELLDMVALPLRPLERPFRMGIHDIQGTMVSGTITSGFVQPNQYVLLMPMQQNVKVLKVYSHDNMSEIAGAGDSVSINLDVDPLLLSSNCVLCHLSDPMPSATDLEVQIVILDIKQPIVPGFQCIYYQRSTQTSCRVVSLQSVHDKMTGAMTKKKPRILNKQQVAKVVLKLDNVTSVDLFQNDKEFGRFLLRKSGETIASGIILKIVK
eukprot:NODE_114_length_19305_cov_0.149849.p2 type:complete len:559 gc:universal NODE_114_length_19305_cov_0.149849:149-1825(+)